MFDATSKGASQFLSVSKYSSSEMWVTERLPFVATIGEVPSSNNEIWIAYTILFEARNNAKQFSSLQRFQYSYASHIDMKLINSLVSSIKAIAALLGIIHSFIFFIYTTSSIQ